MRLPRPQARYRLNDIPCPENDVTSNGSTIAELKVDPALDSESDGRVFEVER